MLAEEAAQLLTGFVDGELSPRERQKVMQLLNQSSEARELLRQLQENVHRIQKLPKHSVQPSLVQDVLQAIAQQQIPTPAPRPSAPVGRALWPKVAAAVAASVVIGVVGVFAWRAVYNPSPPVKDDPAPLAKGNSEKKVEQRPNTTANPEPPPRKIPKPPPPKVEEPPPPLENP